MATIFIADDDSNLRETLSAFLAEEGHVVNVASNGEEALQALTAASATGALPDLLLIDVLMPKLGGFDLAQALQQAEIQIPVAFMSGVYKTAAHQQEAVQKFHSRAYLAKPFPPQRLLEVILEVVGVDADQETAADAPPANPLPAEGNLIEYPVAHLLWRTQRERHTGILDLFGAPPAAERYRMFFYKGRVTMAQSCQPSTNVGIALIRDGVLTADMYQQAVELAVSRAAGLSEVIKTEQWAGDSELKTAYHQVVPAAVGEAVALVGRFRWTDGAAFAKHIPSAPVSPIDCLIAGLRKATAEQLAPHLDPRGKLRLAPGENWDEVGEIIEDACGSSSLVRAINGRANINMLLAAARDANEKVARMRQAYLLMSTCSVIASEQPIKRHAAAEPAQEPAQAAAQVVSAPTPVAVAPVAVASAAPAPVPIFVSPAPAPAAAPAPAPATVAVTPTTPRRARRAAPVIIDSPTAAPLIDASAAEQEAINRIEAKAEAIKDKTLWEVLNVQAGADEASVKKAYFTLARDFHTDTFAGLRLGPAKATLDTLFAQISEAHATLTDPSRRAEYEAKQSMESQGMSTDIGALLEAESQFTKGQFLLEKGEMLAAAKLFEAAVAVNPSNLEWSSHAKYAGWWNTKDTELGKEIIGELQRAYKEQPMMIQNQFFIGMIAMNIGQDKPARTAFKKVFSEQPNHIQASRAMQQLVKRAEQSEKKGGLMGRFLKR